MKDILYKGNLIEKVDDTLSLRGRNFGTGVVGEILNACLAEICGQCATGGKVRLTDFGSFSWKLRKERLGRNPQTGEPITIPERGEMVFKAGHGIKDEMAKAYRKYERSSKRKQVEARKAAPAHEPAKAAPAGRARRGAKAETTPPPPSSSGRRRATTRASQQAG